MGLKHQSVSDPRLSHAHRAGTPIRILQRAEHAKFGTISYEIRRLWQFHYAMACGGYEGLRICHERVLRLPVLSSNDRLMAAGDRPDLTYMVYVVGTQMIVNTVLTMQHFCQEIEDRLDAKLERSTLGERVKEAFGNAGLTFRVDERGYSALQEILERRDALEHPKRENVRNSYATDWDRVPSNWF